MTEPIRVLNIVARLNVGGPAIHVTLITEHLNAPRYQSKLVAGKVSANEGDMGYYAEAHGVAPVIIPELGRELHPLRDLLTLWKVYRLIRQFKPQVVNTHTAKAGFIGRVAARMAGVPVIVHTFHGHVFHGYFSPIKTRFFILLEQISARLSDTIIVLTEGQRDDLADKYKIAPRDKFTIMGYGLDLDVFAQAPRKTGQFRRAWNIPPNVPLVTIVGRLVPVKNHALFLNAAAQVLAQMPEAHFAIIGDGELREPLEAQTDALGIRSAVTFTGWQREVAPIYADSDLLVISSVNEGTPFTVIEAMATGCPVVATAVGGLPDFLDNGKLGVLVPSGDADALANAIVQTLRQPPDAVGLRTMIVERYGIARLIRDLDALYGDRLAKKVVKAKS